MYGTGEGSAALSFNSVRRSDAGQYRCKANNTAGTDETAALSVCRKANTSLLNKVNTQCTYCKQANFGMFSKSSAIL